MNRVGLIGLMQMDLPGNTVRLCDGGFIHWGADTFRSHDPLFGTIATAESLGEGVGDEVAVLGLTFLPTADATPGDLSQPGYQASRVRFWIAEYDVDAGSLVGTPELEFSGQVDRTMLTVGRSRELGMTVVSLAERLFELNIGNSLSPTFHKTVWPGETGHDNATGVTLPDAWGVESPR